MLYIEKRKTNDSTFLTSLTIFKRLDNIMLLNLSINPDNKIHIKNDSNIEKVTGVKTKTIILAIFINKHIKF